MTPRQLQLRDEILQVLFWLSGEGLGDDARMEELAVWIATDGEELAPVLRLMVRDRLVEPAERAGSYRLSSSGMEEGGRRFTEDFADAGLGAQGHGECGPGCDCCVHGIETCHVHGHAGGAP